MSPCRWLATPKGFCRRYCFAKKAMPVTFHLCMSASHGCRPVPLTSALPGYDAVIQLHAIDGEALAIAQQGGGGFGDPKARNEIAVADDVRLGLISSEAAARDYGIVVRDDGQIDHVETARRRGT